MKEIERQGRQKYYNVNCFAKCSNKWTLLANTILDKMWIKEELVELGIGKNMRLSNLPIECIPNMSPFPVWSNPEVWSHPSMSSISHFRRLYNQARIATPKILSQLDILNLPGTPRNRNSIRYPNISTQCSHCFWIGVMRMQHLWGKAFLFCLWYRGLVCGQLP